MVLSNLNVEVIPLWLQLWNLPLEHLTIEFAKYLGFILVTVKCEVDLLVD